MSDQFTFKLYRYSSEDVSTLGLLMAGSEELGKSFRCYTLEDEYREKKLEERTRIPPGKYEIKLRPAGGMHDRSKERWDWHQFGMLWLQNVPGFEWIYIHHGNKHTHTAGCILVGDATTSNVEHVGDGVVSYSVNAYKVLYEEIVAMLNNGQQVFIEVVDWA